MNRDPKQLQEIRTQVAWKLLDGPEFLKPLHKVDENGWLEPVLLIRDYNDNTGTKLSSYSIYVDNTLNRNSKFLKPIARMASWDKVSEDVSAKSYKLPRVDIVQHELTDIEQNSIHTLLVELDKSISDIEYRPDGLFLDSGNPARPLNSLFNNSVSLKRTSLDQTIEFNLSAMQNSLNVENNTKDIIMYIRKICRRPMDINYREAYRTNPFSLFDHEGAWYYRPHTILKDK